MKETKTGANRLKGQLPQGTVVAHKTGTSGTNKTTGVTAAGQRHWSRVFTERTALFH